jgi:hypothetical protein
VGSVKIVKNNLQRFCKENFLNNYNEE